MNKKILVIAIVAIVVIIGAFYLFQKPKVVNAPTSNLPVATSTGNSPSVSGSHDVAITNFAFNPVEIKIKKSETVVWTNQDSAPHTILGNDFKSGTLKKGQSFNFVFENAGTFDYICGVHPSMKGRIIVE